MRLRDYLHDHRLHLIAYVLGLLLLCGGLWLDPKHLVHLDNLIYIAVLVTLFYAGLMWLDFKKQQRWLRQWQTRLEAGEEALDWPMPETGSRSQTLIAKTLNQMLQTHRQTLSNVINTQRDQQAFIDSWVHEIKVPLAASNLLVDSLEDDAPEDVLSQLSLQLDRMDHYVEQVMYYSRLDSFSKDYLLNDYPLKQVINEVVVDNRNAFIAGHLQFELTGDDQVVTTDAKWLRFILMQLFSNALKYTPAGGKITATIAEAHDEVTLTIADSGIGIAQDELHRVFEKGFTGTNGRNAESKSTGLGLYLADQLSQRLGHHLSITAEPDVGTAVTIHFPHLQYYGQSASNLAEQPLSR